MTRREFTLAFVAALVSATIAICVEEYRQRGHSPPTPESPADARFVSVGRDYKSGLGKAYASAIVAGASDLDAGKPISDAMKAIGQGWDRNRQALFDQVVAPELNKVFPEGGKDADVTASQRASLVAALRGLAEGLSE
jgi:hypothetical protein